MTPEEITGNPDRLAALCDLWRSEQKQVWIRIRTGSMQPAIPIGSALLLDCRRESVAVGEPVAYLRGGVLVIHRLVAIEGDRDGQQYLRCRGDANDFDDPPIGWDVVVGVIARIEPPRVDHLGRLLTRTFAGAARWLTGTRR